MKTRKYCWPQGHWDWYQHLAFQHGVKVGPMIFVGGQVDKTSKGAARLGSYCRITSIPMTMPPSTEATWSGERPIMPHVSSAQDVSASRRVTSSS